MRDSLLGGIGSRGFRAAAAGQADGSRQHAAERATIALFIPSLATGGAERQVLLLAKSLDPTRFRVLVVTLTREWRAEEAGDAATHVCLGPGKGFSLVLRLVRLLRQERVDILQAYLLGSQIYALAATAIARRVHLVVSVRASLMLHEIVGWPGKLGHALVFGLRPFVDQYVFNSFTAERRLAGSLAPQRRRVILNGIDTQRFRPYAGADRYARRTAEAPARSRLVGMLANVNPHKGHDVFVAAAAELAPVLRDVVFVVVGSHDGAPGGRLLARVAELSLAERFRFLGPRNDPELLVPGFDVVCSASSSEGFSNAIGEAMACGVPCVVTGVGDSALIVGDTGLVVPPADPPALAAALKRLLLEPPEQLRQRGAAARARVEELFGVRQMVQGHESLYDAVLAGSCRLGSEGER